ncbi:hypothetical protein PC129_g15144 [Phytophthora cactorum]|uniref:Uncharacterized protein n=2 Tax=Phytophthora cactorum TaxID=29920 RepID=A0A8T1HP08_9STRA|nr:hypothetical protein PC119_g18380 [Phytophthora cactorum]KAG3213933.1 hypothetical protein PC129_g15144 [Phytophthora cactorum]
MTPPCHMNNRSGCRLAQKATRVPGKTPAVVRDLNRGRQSIRYITTAPGETRTTALGAPLAPTTMSGFIRRTAARALDLTGYLSPSSSPLPDDDSAQRRGATAAPARSDAPPVLAASAHGSSEASPTAPVAPPAISHAFTAQSALPGVSEDALRDIVDEVATAASDRNLAMSATQHASVTKVLVCAMVQRPRSNDKGFWDQFNRAQTVDELRVRLDSAYAGHQALKVQLLTQTGLRENAELFARQATAEIEELKAELKRAKESDAAHLRRFMDAQVSLDASTETTEKLRQFIKSIQESNLSIQKQVQREREVFKAKVVANAKQTSKLHRLLSDLIKGDSSDVQALQSKQVDLRAMDAVTLVLATEGIASGDIKRDLLDLDQSTRDALAQLQQLDAAAGVSTPLKVNIAKAVHYTKQPGKRRRLRRAGCSSESSPSPSSNSEDSKRPRRKPSGGPKAALAAAGLADVPGIASGPSPSKRRGLRMPKAWRKTKPAKKRRAASGPIAVPPKDRPVFKTTDPRLRGSQAAPANPSSPSPSPIIPSVAAPASGPSLAVTQGSAQASLSTDDSRGARTVSQPAPTDASIVTRHAASPGEGSTRRKSSVTGSGTAAGTFVKVGLRLYPSSMFPVPSHAATSSSAPASADIQLHSPAQFTSSLLAERESASDSDVLGLESEVVEVSSGDGGSRSPAAPSGGDVEEKTEDIVVDSPVQEIPTVQRSIASGWRRSSVESSAASSTSSAPLTHSGPGVVIVSTFAPGFDPRSTIPSSDIPVPVHGVQPIVRSSAKLPSSTNTIVDLRFHKKTTQRCWFAIICARVPTPIGGQAVAPCSIEGIIAFANFADANHPFQAYLRSLPDRSSIFDSSVLDIDMVISRRAPLTLRCFHLWLRLRGQTNNTTLAIA